jgi:hypothetical protein
VSLAELFEVSRVAGKLALVAHDRSERFRAMELVGLVFELPLGRFSSGDRVG